MKIPFLGKEESNPLFMRGTSLNTIKSSAVLDLTDLLMDYGFSPRNAMDTATNFWNKHHKKLKEVL